MDSLLALIAFAIATSATPGPNTLMVSAAAARSGLRAVVPHMLGITLGFPAMLVAIAAGLGWPFQRFPWLHPALQMVGAAWLVWLAWKIAQAPPPDGRPAAPPLGFWGAAAFQWVNPKAWMIALAAVPAFTRPEAPLLPQALGMAAVFALVSLPCLLIWAGVGLGARRFLATPARLRTFNRVMAVLLVLSLVPAFL
ncbi:LysE family translocator [Roseococcus suduntuyensis]|uniref:Threonine/homoserine/homoserine lactone efflux protein n=1 Tax=Roseococcus suduntuyensis TaxID=455361 RepID=A0A840ABR7_9PROT|nr:LysE family translocator [Roseococcus suduntuyensis]MBB3897585.1 threonine/homoserine/homoserine lactone efflux protein [Roseococcus suduntuyensis]